MDRTRERRKPAASSANGIAPYPYSLPLTASIAPGVFKCCKHSPNVFFSYCFPQNENRADDESTEIWPNVANSREIRESSELACRVFKSLAIGSRLALFGG